MKRLTLYFIPESRKDQAETLRRYKLVVNILLITFLFDLDYAFTTISIGMQEGTDMLLIAAFAHLSLVFAVRKDLPLWLITNVYVLVGLSAIVVSIWYSGGFISPVLPWLATTPIVAMLMGGRRTGVIWVCICTVLALYFGIADKFHYSFPVHYDLSWKNTLAINCLVGLILIIFFVSLVFENGKNVALQKLAESSLLLAEEKRKNALHEISQEIHDGVGQTLSIIKLNLHLLEQLNAESNQEKVQETLALTSKAIIDLRNISNNLYTENIQSFDLENALLDDLSNIRKLGNYQSGLTVTGTPYKIEPRTAFILYRIAKEALNNILKHAGASEIRVNLNFEDSFSMHISDNGRGMQYSGEGSGQGLASMKDRMALLGGNLQVDSSKNGTTIMANL